MIRMKVASSQSRTSSGVTFSRTKPRIQRSFSSNSGSVLKSQLMRTSSPPRVTLRRCPTYV